MPGKRINVDLYTVELPSTAPSFADLLASVAGKSRKERISKVSGTPIRLHEHDRKGEITEGEMIRIQMDELPTKADLEGGASPLELTDREGIGHETAFLYTTRLNVLLLQRNQSGVSPAKFARYIEDQTELEGPLHFHPIPLPIAIRRIQKMERLKRLDVRLASMRAEISAESDAPAVNDMISLINKSRSPFFDLVLGVGKFRNRAVDKDSIISIIRGLVRLPADEVKAERIRVTGVEEEEGQAATATLDLLDMTLREKMTVPVLERRLPYHSRIQGLRDILARRREEIGAILRQPEA